MIDNYLPIPGCESFYVFSLPDNIYRIAPSIGTHVGRKMKLQIDKKGYLYVRLYCNGVKKHKLLHRIIAEIFIQNPNNLPEVNHKNGIKTDNRIDNLEWCTRSYNERHAYRELGKIAFRKGKAPPQGAGKRKRPVRGTHNITREVIEMESLAEAARFVNGGSGTICDACRGNHDSAYGYRWEYIE